MHSKPLEEMVTGSAFKSAECAIGAGKLVTGIGHA